MNYLILILVTFFGLNAFSENIDEKIKKFLLNNPEIILQSLENFEKKQIAKKKKLNNQIIAEGNNQVTANNDPTAHAEIVAIRNACKKLGNFFLKGCDLFTSCEPCPMCLSAIYWSHVDNVFYANTRMDAANIDFDDSLIYSEIKKDINERKIKMSQMNREEAIEAFKIWQKKEDKIKY